MDYWSRDPFSCFNVASLTETYSCGLTLDCGARLPVILYRNSDRHRNFRLTASEAILRRAVEIQDLRRRQVRHQRQQVAAAPASHQELCIAMNCCTRKLQTSRKMHFPRRISDHRKNSTSWNLFTALISRV